MTQYKAKPRRSPITTSSRKKQRGMHFNAPSHIRRIKMSAPLSKELQKKYGVRCLPVRKEDEVRVICGFQGGRDGKIIRCYRKKWTIHIDKISNTKANGATYHPGIHPSNVEITKIKIDKCRKALLDRKNRNTTGALQKKLGGSGMADVE